MFTLPIQSQFFSQSAYSLSILFNFQFRIDYERNSIDMCQIRELNAGRRLHEKMMQFLLSVPLMAKLQNESLRDRHWQDLMKKTGHHFCTNPKEFRLSDMFAMNLYKHQVNIILHQIYLKHLINLDLA